MVVEDICERHTRVELRLRLVFMEDFVHSVLKGFRVEVVVAGVMNIAELDEKLKVLAFHLVEHVRLTACSCARGSSKLEHKVAVVLLTVIAHEREGLRVENGLARLSFQLIVYLNPMLLFALRLPAFRIFLDSNYYLHLSFLILLLKNVVFPAFLFLLYG